MRGSTLLKYALLNKCSGSKKYEHRHYVQHLVSWHFESFEVLCSMQSSLEVRSRPTQDSNVDKAWTPFIRYTKAGAVLELLVPHNLGGLTRLLSHLGPKGGVFTDLLHIMYSEALLDFLVACRLATTTREAYFSCSVTMPSHGCCEARRKAAPRTRISFLSTALALLTSDRT